MELPGLQPYAAPLKIYDPGKPRHSPRWSHNVPGKVKSDVLVESRNLAPWRPCGKAGIVTSRTFPCFSSGDSSPRTRAVATQEPQWLPQIATPSSGSAGKRIPFWGSCCLNTTAASRARKSCKGESEGQQLPALSAAVAKEEWRVTATCPGFASVMPPEKSEGGQRRSKGRSSRYPVLLGLSSEEHASKSRNMEMHQQSSVDGQIFFHSAHAKDAAAADPVALRVRTAAEAECAACEDAEELEEMYNGVEDFVNASAAARWSGINLKVRHLGTELLTCLGSHKRRTVLDQLTTHIPLPADSFLSWMPRRVKKPYFLTIVKEEMDKRNKFLHYRVDQAKTRRRTAVLRTSILLDMQAGSSPLSSNSAETDTNQVEQSSSELKPESPACKRSLKRSDSTRKRRYAERATMCETGKLELLVLSCTRAYDLRRDKVFQRLSDNYARIDGEDLILALRLIGFTSINTAWAREAALSVTKHYELNGSEFCEFVKQYIERQSAAHEQRFAELDIGCTGYVECGKFGKLLESVGINAMPHVATDLLVEANLDAPGWMSCGDFESMCRIMVLRKSFTKDFYNNMMSAFNKFALDCETMATSMFLAVMHFIGLDVKDEAGQKIIADIDPDRRGVIDQGEYMSCVGLVLDQEVEALKGALQANAHDWEPEAKAFRLLELFHMLGYMPDLDAVNEAWADAGIAPDDESYELSKIWQLMQIYRSREGLCKQEAQEITETFTKHMNRSELLSLAEVGKVLRSMGYVISFDAQQTLNAKVDLCSTGFLRVREMHKLVRMIRNEDIELMKREFNKVNVLGRRTIPLPLAQQALSSIGCVNPDGAPATLLQHEMITCHRMNGEMDIYAFCTVAMRNRKESRDLFRENGGFSHDDLQELKDVFNHFDSDGSGDIEKRELSHLIEHLMPDYARDTRNKFFILTLIAEGDEDESGSLDFPEFARMVRRIYDYSTMSRISKEAQTIKMAGFDAGEVQSFRDIFMNQAAGAKDLSFGEVRTIMQGICPMGAKQTDEFLAIFMKTLEVSQDATEDQLTADFPDFLCVMKAIIDANFAQVRKKFGFPVSTISRAARPALTSKRSLGELALAASKE